MKKKIFTTFLGVLFISLATAQTIDFVDANFKNKLLEASTTDGIARDLNNVSTKIDTNNDGKIQVNEAENIISLEIENSNIASLEEISFFKYLKYLQCSNNQITTLDLSKNTALTNLYCSGNKLTSLDVTKNTALIELSFGENPIASINLTKNTVLSKLWCNYNLLTTLDVSRNTLLTGLDCMGNQLINLDVTTNTALKYLKCYNNLLTSLDISQNIALTELYCALNQLTTLDISQNIALIRLECFKNQLTTLDVTKNTALTYLSCFENKLSSLDVTKNIALTELSCDRNKLSSLDVSQNIILTKLTCSDNLLPNLDISKNIALTDLNCGRNLLPNLDISKNVALTGLNCDGNLLTSLDISHNTVLSGLECPRNQLTTLDITKNIALITLISQDNQLTTLDVTKNTALNVLWCYNNQLTTLDVTKNTALNVLWCYNNQLTHLNIKNGSIINKKDSLNFSNNPNLKYICADDEELSDIGILASGLSNNIAINSYCTFEASGENNTISGNVNVQFPGSTTCSTPFSNVLIKVEDKQAPSKGYTISNEISGFYKTFVKTGEYTLTPHFENRELFKVDSKTAIFTNLNQSKELDFCVEAQKDFEDLGIYLFPMTNVTKGKNARYRIYARNSRTQRTNRVKIRYTYNLNEMDFVEALPRPSSIDKTKGVVEWEIAEMGAFMSSGINLTMFINDNIPSVESTSEISSDEVTNDINASNNTSTSTTRFNSNSFRTQLASNEELETICLQGDTITSNLINKELNYLIRFKNTGTETIKNAVIIDSIDTSKFDINSLFLIESSNDKNLRFRIFNNNKVEFFFENINLEKDSIGYVLFKIKLLGDVKIGDRLTNKAEIQFDYNRPLQSNEYGTLIIEEDNLSLDNFVAKNNEVLFFTPNPAKDKIWFNEQILSISVFDLNGRLIQVSNFNSKEMDIHRLKSGIYTLKIETDKGIFTRKLIK